MSRGNNKGLIGKVLRGSAEMGRDRDSGEVVIFKREAGPGWRTVS